MDYGEGREYYHCGDPKSGPEGDYFCRYSLCGIDLQMCDPQEAWDQPAHWIVDWWGPESTMPPRCPVCMEHEDFAMLLLGEL
jgi:hypothetical protein